MNQRGEFVESNRTGKTSAMTSFQDSPFSSSHLQQGEGQQEHDLDYDDTGEPTSDTFDDMLRVMKLIQQERHLAAHSLYQHIVKTLNESDKLHEQVREKLSKNNSSQNNSKNSNNSKENNNIEATRAFLETHAQELQQLTQHALIFQRAKDNSATNKDWIQCHHHQNVTSSYRREKDNSLSFKVEGEISGLPLFEQVAIMREVDLYHFWAPFVNGSKRIASLGGKLDQVGWYEVGGIGMVRDSCYRAIGCDCMMESGEIVVVAQGLDDKDGDDNDYDANDDDSDSEEQKVQDTHSDDVSITPSSIDSNDDPERHWHGQLHLNTSDSKKSEFIPNFLAREEILNTINLPPRPKGFNKDRMRLKFFEAVISIHSPTTATTHLVANLDLKLNFVPQFIIDFIMKHMCGLMLVKMQSAAKKALERPEKSPHAIRMRDDDFYMNWLLPKFRNYAIMKNWDMPEVNALKEEFFENSILGRAHSDGEEIGTGNDNGDGLRRVLSADDASQVSRRTFSSKISGMRKKIKVKTSRTLSDASVQSAPVRVAGASHQNGSAKKPMYSSVQKRRLEELRAFRAELGKEPSPMEEMKTSITKPLRKMARMGRVDHILNDYSHLVVLPTLFLIQFIVYYAINYEHQFVGDFWMVRKALIGTGILFVFSWLHWKIVETVCISTFDTIDLPVIKFTGSNTSSSTRQYVIERVRSASAVFSAIIAAVAIGKGITVFLLRRAIFLGKWLAAVVAARSLAAESPETCVVPVWIQMVHDTRAMMAYSAVFLVIICSMAIATYPSTAGKPIKITHRAGYGSNEDLPAVADTNRSLEPFLEAPHSDDGLPATESGSPELVSPLSADSSVMDIKFTPTR